MKSVYIKTTTIEITLTNGNTIVKDDYNPLGFMRYMYQYGEVPSDTATEYNDKPYSERDYISMIILLEIPISVKEYIRMKSNLLLLGTIIK